MGQALGAIFGAPEIPEAAPEEEKTAIDPNRDEELRQATLRRRSIFGRRGRSALKGGPKTRGGVSVNTAAGPVVGPKRGTGGLNSSGKIV
jgi:hypothetical protein